MRRHITQRTVRLLLTLGGLSLLPPASRRALEGETVDEIMEIVERCTRTP
ncbi:MAG: hypothetical protein QF689_08290 [Candidatus Latescibacteria bacterium]|nr:hypothetical protein [Candidatus Latescibacterota bacterium]MDP7448568.1 hypothetical protein [Candidatus Latescibacterota bacterium]